MLMTQHETALSQHADKLFAAIQSLGEGWHGRAEIAQIMKKRRLTTYDAAALDLLIMQGRVEAEQHKIDAPIQVRWEYRVKE